MKQLTYKSLGITLLLLSFFVNGLQAQKQTKNFKESFEVDANAVLDINTTYTDIEFETWDKNQIQVEVTIEVEGMSEDEAASYFEKNKFEIWGNSSTVSIRSGKKNPWFVRDFHHQGNYKFDIVIPELPDLDESVFDVYEFPDIKLDFDWGALSDFSFDYKEFEKHGDKYLEEWKKEHGATLKEIQRAVRKELKENKAKVKKERNRKAIRYEKLRAERKKALLERKKERRKAYVERREELVKRRERQLKKRQKYLKGALDTLYFNVDSLSTNVHELLLNVDTLLLNTPSTIYYPSKKRKHKIKKTVRVKMPKSTTLKMNVRHGEVKLAENTKNMKANLAYASLFAYAIDGDHTEIEASYSPISVEKWNYGQLKAAYSEEVKLKEVQNLILDATSSHVTIDRLLQSALIQNDFGPLQINYVSKNFKDVDINIENGELHCNLPTAPFTIYVNGTASKLSSPASLVLSKTKGSDQTLHKGYYKTRNTDKSIVINSKYSDVVLKE
ncbi:hypothetical protein [Spongiimicrobium salis]|uniref:hypothetical protein n=1 Tax=Spongiimicrobium salis TaxID=1667022 RepID=UPI00374D2F61